jgi:hypothetical protein
MSDAHRGPDWWLASDGRYYPPTSRPGYEAGAAAASTPLATGPARHLHHPANRRTWIWWLVGVVVVLLLADVGALTYQLVNTSPLSAVPLGPGTATITWHNTQGITHTKPVPQPFTGTIAGYAISGTAYPNALNSAPPKPGAPFLFMRIKGSLGGNPLTLAEYASITTANPTLEVRGTFDGRPVRGVLEQGKTTSQVKFSGSVGAYHVVGVIDNPSGHADVTVKASFTVSS